ncbi:uncharacterized protein LOC118203913 [Stegodyphus dumicola]|uniref:uncharacterized protein LOC118203913 n=1 Tax=Stegodyphus dumicola TaxID=202533 RepID=UPI0015B31F48|nr:uncharacterized protein LOC118203913 [Stegodyphus dumicola]
MARELIQNIKALQINLARSHVATAQLKTCIFEYDLIFIIQEPYCINDKPSGFPTQTHFSPNEHPKTATVVVNPRLTVLNTYASSTLNVITLKIENRTITIFNCYSQPITDLTDLTNLLNLAERYFDDQHDLLLLGDLNAKSELWGSPFEDPRGRTLREFLTMHRLVVENDPDGPPTYNCTRGKSWIDITASRSISSTSFIHNWKVMDCITLSDHCYISFEITYQHSSSTQRVKYKLTQMDWLLLKAKIGHFFGSMESYLPKDTVDLNQLIIKWTQKIQEYCDLATHAKGKYVKTQHKGVPWWTPELSILRKRILALRKRYHKCIS